MAIHYAQNNFELISDRNVVVVGRTGVGKSMLVNQILGGPYVKVRTGVDPETKKVQIIQGILEFNKNRYFAKIIDTVGFNDSSKRVKSDTEIVEEITSTIREIKSIHLIIFVFKKESYHKDITMLRLLTNAFEGTLYEISAAVITHFDDYIREGEKNKLLQNREIGDFFKKMAKGVHFVSFPDLGKMYKTTKDAKEKVIDEDGKNMCKLIAESEKSKLPLELFKQTSTCCIL